MNETINSLLPLLSALAAFITVVAFYYKFKKDLQEINYDKGIGDGLIKSELAHIRDQLDELNVQLKTTAITLSAISEKLARVDESVKSAHKRISDLSKLYD